MGLGVVISKGTSGVPILLELLVLKKSICVNSVIRSKHGFTVGVVEVLKVAYAKYNLS